MITEDLCNTAELVRRYPYWTRQFWDRMRCHRTGPPYYRVGRRVLYDPAEVAAWIALHYRGADPSPQPTRPAP